MRDDCLDLCRQREFIVITSGRRKEKRREGGDTEGNMRQSERLREKLYREICLPDSCRQQCALQRGDNTERVTVEERRCGQAGGHEPTCRLGQKLWLQRGEVRRRGILMTQKPARQVWRGGMTQIPPSSSFTLERRRTLPPC